MVLTMTIAWIAPAHANKFTDTIGIYKKSPAVTSFFKNCHGYVVFPAVGGQKFSFEAKK